MVSRGNFAVDTAAVLQSKDAPFFGVIVTMAGLAETTVNHRFPANVNARTVDGVSWHQTIQALVHALVAGMATTVAQDTTQ